MKVKAIINPHAGRVGMASNLVRGLERFEQEGLISKLELRLTEAEGEARSIVSTEDHSEFDILLAAGGDGTINNVVNGMMLANQKIPLLICAAGTVNDFGVANDLPQDLDGLEELLRDYVVEAVDIGEANGAYFLNVAAGGFLSEISFITPRTMKMFLGQFAYYVTAMLNFHQIFKPYHLKISGPDFTIEDDFLFFVFGNCQSVGGFRNLVPLANVQDGVFDLLCLRSDPHYLKPNIIPLLIDILNGAHLSHPAFFHIQTSELKIETDRELIVDIDGEKGPAAPLEIKVHHKALNLVLPRENTLEGKQQEELE
ncbi:MAG: diacylglycerol kinase family lipid kinase [Eubacteriales bacterium]|nr:diacylglycerol kinase family lipid kinase [Eubacteriales bacterium]